MRSGYSAGPGCSAASGSSGAAGVPALRLSGTVLSTKPLRAGEGVSYTHLFIAPADTRIALVTGGYGQGIVRGLGGRVRVAIGERMYPIVGRIAMDVCVVEIGDADVRPGAEVDFFGGSGAVRDALAEWEAASGWSAAEIVCGIALRVPREWTP